MTTPRLPILGLSILLLASLFSCGCAFGTRHAKITYPPAVSNTNKVALISAPPGSQGEIVLQPFTDDRADKRLVGHVRNGYGMKTAKVVTDDADLTALINEAVHTELVRAGYTVLKAQGPETRTTPMINGALVELYCDAYMTYEGKASLYVRITREGNEVFRKTYTGEGSVGLNWAMTGKSYGNSLSLALQDALELVKRDLPIALKQKLPSSGEP